MQFILKNLKKKIIFFLLLSFFLFICLWFVSAQGFFDDMPSSKLDSVLQEMYSNKDIEDNTIKVVLLLETGTNNLGDEIRDATKNEKVEIDKLEDEIINKYSEVKEILKTKYSKDQKSTDGHTMLK